MISPSYLRCRGVLLSLLFFVYSLISFDSCQAQIHYEKWARYAESSAYGMVANGTTTSDYQRLNNDDQHRSISASSFAHLQDPRSQIYGSGTARQVVVVEPWRFEAAQYGDTNALASGPEDTYPAVSLSTGATSSFSNTFTVTEVTPYVIWGAARAPYEAAYTRFYDQEDPQVVTWEETSGWFFYSGIMKPGVVYTLDTTASVGASADASRDFRSNLYQNEVHFKVNTPLPRNFFYDGVLSGGSLESLWSPDSKAVTVSPLPSPTASPAPLQNNSISVYSITRMPPKTDARLVVETRSTCGSLEKALTVSSFNYKLKRWVVGYQGPASQSYEQHLMSFPGVLADYVASSRGTIKRDGDVTIVITYQEIIGKSNNWECSVDMIQASWSYLPPS